MMKYLHQQKIQLKIQLVIQKKKQNSINDLTKFNNIENKIYKIEQDMKKKDQKKILTIQIIIK